MSVELAERRLMKTLVAELAIAMLELPGRDELHSRKGPECDKVTRAVSERSRGTARSRPGRGAGR